MEVLRSISVEGSKAVEACGRRGCEAIEVGLVVPAGGEGDGLDRDPNSSGGGVMATEDVMAISISWSDTRQKCSTVMRARDSYTNRFLLVAE